MIKRLLSSGLWLIATAVLALAMMQPALANCICNTGCHNPGDGSCATAHYEGTNYYFCICKVSYASCGDTE